MTPKVEETLRKPKVEDSIKSPDSVKN